MTELALPRRREAVALACDAAEQLVVEAGWPEADTLRVVLALGEAVANAVEHADAQGPVHLSFEVDPARARAVLRDGGEGPGAAQIEAATLPADLQATTGRGLYMIRELSDRIDAHPGSLTLEFQVRP